MKSKGRHTTKESIMITSYKLAKLCEKSYTEKTFSTHGVEVLVERVFDQQIIAIRGTEINKFDEKSIIKKIKGTDGKDIIRNIFIPDWYAEGLIGSAGVLWGAKSVIKVVGDFVIKSDPVWITGHSLGGGIAIPLTRLLHTRGFNVAGLVTFGCPRVLSWGHNLYSNIKVVQYEYRNDIVPELLFWTFKKHLDRTHLGEPRSNKRKDRTWDDHKMELYTEAIIDT